MILPYLLVTGLAACAALGWGQTKISGTGKCDKPETQQSIDVGDRAGHALLLVKQQCTWTTPIEMEGLKSKTYTVTSIGDASTNRVLLTKQQDNGYVVVTMDNGDQAFVRFRGSSSMDKGQPVGGEGTWSYTGGTGKLKGITGKGTYKNTNGEDQVEGEYSIAAAKSKK
jgi:hypothetical protein